MNQPDITPILDELRQHTRVGAVTLFYGSERELGAIMKPAHIVMSVLGIRACMDRVATPFPALQRCMVMRKISLVYPDREQFVLLRIDEPIDYPSVAEFIRKQLFDILSADSEPLTWYRPERFRNFTRRFSNLISDEPSPIGYKESVPSCSISPEFTEDIDDDEIMDDDDGDHAVAESIDFMRGIAPAPTYESESQLDEEKRAVVSRLTDVVFEYIQRFGELPPMSLIGEIVRGKMQLRATLEISRVRINGDLKIILPDYDELEIKMTPLARTIYILFLLHPEGIRLKYISDYASQISEIYMLVKPGADDRLAAHAVAELVVPGSQSLQEKISMTRRAVKRHIADPSLAERYLIKGNRGGLYGIDIPADKIITPAILRP